MPWIELSLHTDAEHFAQFEEALLATGALSVTATDDADQPILEPGPGETPLWSQVRITGMFEAETDLNSIRTQLEALLGVEALQGLQVNELQDQEWSRTWMDHFQPMAFGNRLWVCPEGFEPPDPQAVNLRLDPGLAFGTGTHPTTALCLEWLDGHAVDDCEVIDYGCGSGILAIAALLLGAKQTWCVDNDEQALIATRDNAIKNHVEDCMTTLMPEAADSLQADITLANILAGPLVSLAPRLSQYTRANGHIVLSGITTEQAAEVSQVYSEWFEMDPPRRRDDWCLLHGVRKSVV